LLEETLEKLKGQGTPAVVIAVYGNRAYEDALLEGADWLEKQGFQMAAAGALIGEHSFSAALAAGRPDQDDLAQAARLGEKEAEKTLAGARAPRAGQKGGEKTPGRRLGAAAVAGKSAL